MENQIFLTQCSKAVSSCIVGSNLRVGEIQESSKMAPKSEFSEEEIYSTAIDCPLKLAKLQKPKTHSVVLVDMSSNGTFVNDCLVGKDNTVELQTADVIAFGSSDSEDPNSKR